MDVPAVSSLLTPAQQLSTTSPSTTLLPWSLDRFKTKPLVEERAGLDKREKKISAWLEELKSSP